MMWKLNITYILYLFLYIGREIYHVRAVKIDCTIPRRSWYRRSMYRQRSGSTENYPAGSKVSHGTEIVAICRKDVYGDVIANWIVTQCIDGDWVPALPSCKVRKRCRAPPQIKHAKPSDTVTQHKTFPHGTVLTYTCDAGKMATGNGTAICDNGHWSVTGFKCEGTTTPLRADNNRLGELCSRLSINNGLAFVKDDSHGIYDVRCDKGYRLAFDKVYKCKGGKWIGKEPECRKVKIDCTIPRRSWYRRSMYRQRSGSTENYPAGSKVSHGTEIVAICKKDVYGDVITNWTVTQCIDGNWVPGLPSCKVKGRCRAPPEIKHAKPSDTVTPNRTFPHGSVLTYNCDVGKMATGNGTTVCDNGRWTGIGFKCEETMTPNTTDNNTLGKLCARMTINNGQKFAKDDSNGIYDVKCDKGYRLAFNRVYKCRDGKWIGKEPECRKAKCQFPSALRAGSILRRKRTREVIHTMFVDHWTQAVQTCKKKSRGETSRIVRCVNGRWRPSLMPCRQKLGRVAIIKDTTPKVADTTTTTSTVNPRNDVTNLGWMASGSDIQPTSRKALLTGLLPAKCYQPRVFASYEVGDGSPSDPRPDPAIQIPDENDQLTVITDTTPKVEETTTKTTTTTTSTVKPSIEYRIHVQVTQETVLPAYIVLDGNVNRGVELALDSPENLEGLSVYTVKGKNVGEIEQILTSSTNNSDVNFVSVHNPDVNGFYIQRFDRSDQVRPQEIMGKPCKRQYGEDLDMQPKYPEYSNYGKGNVFSSVQDVIDCKLLCIEELDFTCELASYYKDYHSCYTLEKYDTNHYEKVPERVKDDILSFKREDTC